MSDGNRSGIEALAANLVWFARFLLASYPNVAETCEPMELVAEAVASLLEQEQRQAIDNREAYLKRSMFHDVLGRGRRYAREASAALDPHPDDCSTASDVMTDDAATFEDVWSEARRVGRSLRSHLERFPPPTAREKVHFRAVFLVALRANLWTTTLREIGGFQFGWGRRDSMRFVETWCPWKREWKQARLRRGYPTAGEVWQAVVACDQWPSCGYVVTLLRVINDLRDQTEPGLTSDTWYQWVNRAKKRGREAIGEVCWLEQFSRWFPDHNPAEDA